MFYYKNKFSTDMRQVLNPFFSGGPILRLPILLLVNSNLHGWCWYYFLKWKTRPALPPVSCHFMTEFVLHHFSRGGDLRRQASLLRVTQWFGYSWSMKCCLEQKKGKSWVWQKMKLNHFSKSFFGMEPKWRENVQAEKNLSRLKWILSFLMEDSDL